MYYENDRKWRRIRAFYGSSENLASTMPKQLHNWLRGIKGGFILGPVKLKGLIFTGAVKETGVSLNGAFKLTTLNDETFSFIVMISGYACW